MQTLVIDSMTSSDGVKLVLVSNVPFDGIALSPPDGRTTWCPLCFFSSVDPLLVKRKGNTPNCYGHGHCMGTQRRIWMPKDYYEKRKGDWEKCTTKS